MFEACTVTYLKASAIPEKVPIIYRSSRHAVFEIHLSSYYGPCPQADLLPFPKIEGLVFEVCTFIELLGPLALQTVNLYSTELLGPLAPVIEVHTSMGILFIAPGSRYSSYQFYC